MRLVSCTQRDNERALAVIEELLKLAAESDEKAGAALLGELVSDGTLTVEVVE